MLGQHPLEFIAMWNVNYRHHYIYKICSLWTFSLLCVHSPFGNVPCMGGFYVAPEFHRDVYAKSLSKVRFFATLWTIVCQALLFMGFPRQEYWSELPFPSPGLLWWCLCSRFSWHLTWMGEDSSARFSLMKMKCSFEHFLHFIDFVRCPCILITESI